MTKIELDDLINLKEAEIEYQIEAQKIVSEANFKDILLLVYVPKTWEAWHVFEWRMNSSWPCNMADYDLPESLASVDGNFLSCLACRPKPQRNAALLQLKPKDVNFTHPQHQFVATTFPVAYSHVIDEQQKILSQIIPNERVIRPQYWDVLNDRTVIPNTGFCLRKEGMTGEVIAAVQFQECFTKFYTSDIYVLKSQMEENFVIYYQSGFKDEKYVSSALRILLDLADTYYTQFKKNNEYPTSKKINFDLQKHPEFVSPKIRTTGSGSLRPKPFANTRKTKFDGEIEKLSAKMKILCRASHKFCMPYLNEGKDYDIKFVRKWLSEQLKADSDRPSASTSSEEFGEFGAQIIDIKKESNT